MLFSWRATSTAGLRRGLGAALTLPQLSRTSSVVGAASSATTVHVLSAQLQSQRANAASFLKFRFHKDGGDAGTEEAPPSAPRKMAATAGRTCSLALPLPGETRAEQLTSIAKAARAIRDRLLAGRSIPDAAASSALGVLCADGQWLESLPAAATKPGTSAPAAAAPSASDTTSGPLAADATSARLDHLVAGGRQLCGAALREALAIDGAARNLPTATQTLMGFVSLTELLQVSHDNEQPPAVALARARLLAIADRTAASIIAAVFAGEAASTENANVKVPLPLPGAFPDFLYACGLLMARCSKQPAPVTSGTDTAAVGAVAGADGITLASVLGSFRAVRHIGVLLTRWSVEVAAAQQRARLGADRRAKRVDAAPVSAVATPAAPSYAISDAIRMIDAVLCIRAAVKDLGEGGAAPSSSSPASGGAAAASRTFNPPFEFATALSTVARTALVDRFVLSATESEATDVASTAWQLLESTSALVAKTAELRLPSTRIASEGVVRDVCAAVARHNDAMLVRLSMLDLPWPLASSPPPHQQAQQQQQQHAHHASRSFKETVAAAHGSVRGDATAPAQQPQPDATSNSSTDAATTTASSSSGLSPSDILVITIVRELLLEPV